MELPFEKRLEKYLGVSLLEIELLTSLSLKPVYFQPGEVLPNGYIAKPNNHKYYIKTWEIISPNSFNEIRKMNVSKLLEFKKINDISVLKAYNNLIHITTEGVKGAYLYTIEELMKLSGLSSNQFHLLHSSYI